MVGWVCGRLRVKSCKVVFWQQIAFGSQLRESEVFHVASVG